MERWLSLTRGERRHFVFSFLLSLSIRGDIIENAWAAALTAGIIILHEVMAAVESESDGVNLLDLCRDISGSIVGYIFAIML